MAEKENQATVGEKSTGLTSGGIWTRNSGPNVANSHPRAALVAQELRHQPNPGMCEVTGSFESHGLD
jgi:hypothetical protein